MLAESDQSTSNHPILTTNLGPLETQAMEILWTGGECKVRDVMKALNRHLAYTTVMTTLDRLFRKKLVSRRKCVRAYVYSPRITCQEWKDAVTRDLLDKLMAGPQVSREVLIECLMEAVGQQDATLADEIARIANEKCADLAP